MSVDLAVVIREAINETVMAFFVTDIGIEAGPSVIKPENHPYQPPQADVTAIVGFSGSMEGGVHLSAPEHTAIALAAAFAGETPIGFDELARDAFGELANIVAGAVKGRLTGEHDAQINLTPPQIVTGADCDMHFTKTLQSTKCYFKTLYGPFFIEIFHVDVHMSSSQQSVIE